MCVRKEQQNTVVRNEKKCGFLDAVACVRSLATILFASGQHPHKVMLDAGLSVLEIQQLSVDCAKISKGRLSH